MALSANTAWEVRPTNGRDDNSGGFVAGSSGTDWSQQNFPQYSVNDGVTNGTTTITSASATFGTDVVGNLIYVSGGTGSITAGWYQITARTNSTTITVDRSTGLTAGTGVTLHIGGALKTLSQVSAVYVGGNKIFVKAEATISLTAGVSFAVAGSVPSISVPWTRIIGYTSSRTDGGRVTVQLSTNTGLTAVTLSGTGHSLENFSVDCNSLGTSTGLSATQQYNRFLNCKVANFKTAGISLASSKLALAVYGCEITGGLSGATAAINESGAGSNIWLIGNYVHDNVCTGINIQSNLTLCYGNLVTNNTGASSDGIYSNISQQMLLSNVVYGSGRDGIRLDNSQALTGTVVKNNILAKNSGYGFNQNNGAGCAAFILHDGNAFWSNTSGSRNNLDDTSTNAIDGVSPYSNMLDIVITDGSPFTNDAGGDFTLNATALRGALIRGHGVPATLPGATGTSYEDMGVFQHQDPASGGINRAAYPSGVSSVG